MTEIEQLRADLANLEASRDFLQRQGCPNIALGVLTICELTEKRIADLEAQQAQADEWAEVKQFIDYSPDEGSNPMVKRYIRHLEVKVAELDHELRCERIDGGKVRDDQKAFTADRNREKLAELTTILNAIPPACGLARELVDRRIEGVKKEMQGNG